MRQLVLRDLKEELPHKKKLYVKFYPVLLGITI